MTLPQERLCARCRTRMTSGDSAPKPSSPFIWGDRGFDYECPECGHAVFITSRSSILFGFLTGTAGLTLLGWGLCSLKSLVGLFRSGAMGIALGAGVAALVLFLVIGGGVAAWTSLQALRIRLTNPPVSPGLPWGRILSTVIVSSLPVALAVGAGFYDHYVRDLDDYSVVVLPIIFSPLLLGGKLGLSFLGLFLGCAMWMGLLVAAIFLF